jgi:hypothetical protein
MVNLIQRRKAHTTTLNSLQHGRLEGTGLISDLPACSGIKTARKANAKIHNQQSGMRNVGRDLLA